MAGMLMEQTFVTYVSIPILCSVSIADFVLLHWSVLSAQTNRCTVSCLQRQKFTRVNEINEAARLTIRIAATDGNSVRRRTARLLHWNSRLSQSI